MLFASVFSGSVYGKEHTGIISQQCKFSHGYSCFGLQCLAMSFTWVCLETVQEFQLVKNAAARLLTSASCRDLVMPGLKDSAFVYQVQFKAPVMIFKVNT